MGLEQFFDNFELIADAPNGVAELRKMILQLAVQGRLVPQDPDDEPVTKLLQQIREERERLIKEGAIKRLQAVMTSTKQVGTRDLPKGWTWISLPDIGYFSGGGTPSKNRADYWNGQIPWVSPKDMKTARIETTELSISEEAIENSAVKLIQRGSLLIVVRSGILKRMFPVAISEITCAINQDMKAITPYITNTNRYIQIMLWGYESFILEHLVKGGVTVQSIKGAEFSKQLFPLPPLAEQHRIVTKVDQLMAHCEELEKRQNKKRERIVRLNNSLVDRLLAAREPDEFDEHWERIRDNFDLLYDNPENVGKLRQAVLQLGVQGKLVPQDPNDEPAAVLLEKIKKEKERLIKEGVIKKQKPLPPIKPGEVPFDLPKGWEVTCLDNIVNITSGVTKGRKLSGRELISVPYLRVANVQRGFLDLDVIKEIDIPKDELEKFKVIERDLLITEGGDWDKVGRTSIWHGEIPLVIHQNHIFKARPFFEEQNVIWLEKYINSSVARDYFAQASKQTTNLASINMTELRCCIIPFPPKNEQHRIVAKVDQLMAHCDELETALSKQADRLTRLSASLTHTVSAAPGVG